MRGGPEEGGKDWLPLALWESALFVMETRLRRSLKQAWSYSKWNSEFCLCQYLVFVCLLDLSILPATFTRKPAPAEFTRWAAENSLSGCPWHRREGGQLPLGVPCLSAIP